MTAHWLLSIVVTSFLAGPASAPQEGQVARRPNVIVIFPDQLRWCSLGCYGDPVIRSPNIDRLAAEGVRFRQAFSNFPVCSPARAVLLSGRYARSNGVVTNQDTEAQPERLNTRSITLAEVLAGQGYHTALIGKWHLAPNPQLLGFQESLRPRMRHRYYHQTYYKNEREVYVHDGYGPDHEAEAAVEYIRHHREQPFFLYLAYGPPHMPLDDLPREYRTLYAPNRIPLRDNVWKDGRLAYDENWFKIYLWDFRYYEHKATFPGSMPAGMDLRQLTALYYGQITAVDDCVGRVLAALKEAGIEQDTLVVLTSDHGDMLGSHHLFNKNSPYDESIRVPLIVRYPRRLKPRLIDQEVAGLVDLMPTILQLCGANVPDSVQGASLVPKLMGPCAPAGESKVFFETSDMDGLRTPRYTCAVARDSRGQGREQLFDVEQDPYQMRNLASDPTQGELLKSLRAELEAWRRSTPWAGQGK